MSEISILSRLLNGVIRSIDLAANTLVVDTLKVGGATGTALTKTTLDSLIAAPAGEVNTASNLGIGADGEGLAGTKSGSDLPFKRIKAGTNVTLTSETNDIKIDVSAADKVVKTFVAGEAFAANTTFAVRMALTGETAGRVYKADYDASVSDKFYAYGVVEGNGAAAKSIADPIVVVLMGEVTLGSSDTNFAAGEIGQPVHLLGSGGWDALSQITYTTGQASYRIGMVQEVGKILVGNMQMFGVN